MDKVLVTGGTGFLSSHIILKLLNQGFKVKTTIRNLSKKKNILETLKNNGVTNIDNLSFVEANLLEDKNWALAMEDCKYVLSVASPVFFDIPDNEDEVIKPALEGTIRILKFAEKSNVQRVVMTSNFGAIGFSNMDKNSVTTEKNWTDPNEKGLSLYEKSKLLAELKAWEFIKISNLEFVTINPVAIFGISLNGHFSGSFSLIDGTMKVLPNLQLNIVDVRDVADLHIKAMLSPKANGERFIASTDDIIDMKEIYDLIKKERPKFLENNQSKILPTNLIKLASIFNKQAKEGVHMLSINRNISNNKAKEILNWNPRGTNQKLILDSIDSMMKFNK